MQMMNICQSENVNHMVSTTVKESPGKLVEEFFSLFQFDQLECSHKKRKHIHSYKTKNMEFGHMQILCKKWSKNGQ